MKKVLLGFILGTAVGVLAQGLDVAPVPAYSTANKQLQITVSGGSRLVCAIDPSAYTPGNSGSLIDYTVAGGKTLTGTLWVQGVIQ